MRMVFFGTASIYAVGVVLTALGQAVTLYSEGWGVDTLALRALEVGLSWPMLLVGLLTEIRF
ncbi:hypothetical protein [Ferruginivarius sediminum]|uniref:Uncharacterized protein n=1 Tax=Ferruginivarius sediminum TaxID=2661937 RepID=A0A369T8V1_9PROT|nr:hypothetical protein [Ferruginivarius sediminum]RDD60904.1 hypothetical protein DRB17_15705 [Ferruginivarius sediminum]